MAVIPSKMAGRRDLCRLACQAGVPGQRQDSLMDKREARLDF